MDNFGDNRMQPTRFVGHGNIKFTREGGLAIRLNNKTGAASEKGRLVSTSTSVDHAVELGVTEDVDIMGVMYETGRVDGEDMWVVIAGICDVLLKNNTSCTRGYWVGSSDEGSYAYATLASPPAQPDHFREIGHCFESKAAEGEGTHVLARIVLQFN